MTGCLRVEYHPLVRACRSVGPVAYERILTMKIVSIHNTLLSMYSADSEVLTKAGRPCVLLVRLRYKEKTYDFAVPFRSNIPAGTPKNHYFPLPPRPSTKPHNRHGLHYIKMFPVTKNYLVRYRTKGNASATLYKSIIAKNAKQIVIQCQTYLDDYANGVRPQYSTNIDYLLSILFPNK